MMAKINHQVRFWFGLSSFLQQFLCISAVLQVLVFSQVSCTTAGKKVQHKWAALDSSLDLECSPWPGVDDLATISDVVFRNPAGGEVLAAGTGLDRSGKAAMFVAAISKDSNIEAVMTTYKGPPPHLFRGSCPLPNPSSGAVLRAEWGAANKDGCLVLGRDAADAPAVGLMASSGATTAISLAGMAKGFASGQSVVPKALADGSVLVVAEPDLSDAVKQTLPWVKLNAENIIESGVLNLKAGATIESARALPVDGGVFFALVTGDSLVGEGGLEVSFFRFGLSDPVWSKSMKLAHTHLGDPALVSDGSSGHAVLMIPKWVDLESTIGTYRLSPEGLVASANQGIFPGASVVVDSSQITGGAAVMIRSRTKDKWRYKLCEMKWNAAPLDGPGS